MIKFLKIFVLAFLMMFGAARGSAQEISGFPRDSTQYVDFENIPDDYDFTIKCAIEIGFKKEEPMKMTYYLKPGSGYNALVMIEPMMVINDEKNGISITTMGKGYAVARKRTQMAELPQAEDIGNLNFKPIAEKTIVGYKCQGAKAENDQVKVTLYYSSETLIQGADSEIADSEAFPPSIKNYLKSVGNPALMRAEVTDRASKQTMVFKCVQMEKTDFVFRKTDHEFVKY